MKVGVVANMVDPNRVALFERVAARADVRLLVVYETPMESNREWRAELDLPYPHAVLRSKSIDLQRFGTDAYLHLPMRPLAPFARDTPDVIVGAGGGIWSSPANTAALAMRSRHGWAFAPWWGSFGKASPTLARRLAEPWIRRFLRSSDACLSYGSRASATLESLGVPPGRIVVVPNAPREGADIEPVRDRDRNGVRFLFVGQLIERKGIDVLLEAFAKLDGPHELRIVGNGALKDRVIAAAAGDFRISYLGHGDWDKIQELYATSDALVLPSLYEVWGLVINEAMAHDCAIIASDAVGAVDDLLEPGVTGYVVEPGSSVSLYEALSALTAWEPTRWQRASERARARLETWSLDTAADRFLTACSLAVEERRKARRDSENLGA